MVNQMENWKAPLETRDGPKGSFRITDYPMHYFAAIQKRNQVNLARKLEHIELSPLDWRIIAALQDHGSMTINDLSEATVFDRFKVARGVNDLVGRGYLNDAPRARDGRSRRVVLSEDGQRKYHETFNVVAEVYRANFAGLSDAEFNQLMQLLRRIKDNVYRTEGY